MSLGRRGGWGWGVRNTGALAAWVGGSHEAGRTVKAKTPYQGLGRVEPSPTQEQERGPRATFT